jgi:two-component system, OmpR family, alkaline phosphatase synthesis response regulator PhoP
MKVLIAEDDEKIRRGLAEILEEEGYRPLLAKNGSDALKLFRQEHPDFVLLDIMMPGKSGYDVCREIRQRDSQVPIIFISAKSEEIDKVLGLELGADDYILKPFGIKEVSARIRAVTRRCQGRASGPGSERFVLEDLEVDPVELRARRGAEVIELSLREVEILKLFHERRGQVIDRDTLLDRCWGVSYLPSSRTLDQHISKLRKKIERDPKDPQIIQTVHGSGYRMKG